MDMRVDKAQKKKLPCSENHRCASRFLRSRLSLDADDAAILDGHAALLDMIGFLWGDDGDVSDPDPNVTKPSKFINSIMRFPAGKFMKPRLA